MEAELLAGQLEGQIMILYQLLILNSIDSFGIGKSNSAKLYPPGFILTIPIYFKGNFEDVKAQRLIIKKSFGIANTV